MTVAATVWLASYPKSGNTWFRAVLAAARTGNPFDLIGSNLAAAARLHFDVALGISSTDLTADEIAVLRPLADEQHAATRAERTPLVRKIHDALRSDPGGALIVSAAITRCAVYLVRDPRDVAVSFAHHNGRDLAWAVERMCLPSATLLTETNDVSPQFEQRLGTWSDHVRSWVDAAPFPVTVVRYEDCLADPLATFGAALDFAGLALPEDELASAVEAAGFERLRDQEAARGFAEVFNRRSPFFRQGRSGSWQEELPASLARRLEDEHGEVMVRLGYLGSGAVATPSTAASNASTDASA